MQLAGWLWFQVIQRTLILNVNVTLTQESPCENEIFWIMRFVFLWDLKAQGFIKNSNLIYLRGSILNIFHSSCVYCIPNMTNNNYSLM